MTDSGQNKIELAHLRNVLHRMVAIPDGEWAYAAERIYKRSYQKGDFLVRAGDLVSVFFFIIRGLVRFYYCSDSGREFIKHFAKEGDTAGSYVSTILNVPCSFFIQALEPTETFIISNRLLRELYDRHPAWERLGRIKSERLAIQKELREKEFLLDSAEVRYRRFVEEYPDLINRIPQYHIASYLGITDVALSRIRKKMSKINLG